MKCKLPEKEPQLPDVFRRVRSESGGIPSTTNEEPLRVQPTQAVDSFFWGLPPRITDYFSRSINRAVNFPLAAGARQNLIVTRLPSSQTIDITGLYFYMLAPVGAGWAVLPDDFAQEAFSFEVWRNGSPPWRATLTGTIGNEVQGFDVLNQNVLGMFGSTPVHLLLSSSTELTISFVPRNVLFVAPANLRAGVRFTGVQGPSERFDRAAR